MKNRFSPARILVFGDSILKGVRYENGRYQVDRHWQQAFSEDFGVPVENYSRFGNTIEKAMQGLRRICEQPAQEREIALLELGGNDCDYNWTEISANPDGRYHCRTVPERFVAFYREAVSLLRESGREPVALTLPPILSERYLDYLCSRGASKERLVNWLGFPEELSLWQKTYSCLVRQIAREENVRLIDLQRRYPADEVSLSALIGSDGIHPSQAGQELIFRILCEDARSVLI